MFLVPHHSKQREKERERERERKREREKRRRKNIQFPELFRMYAIRFIQNNYLSRVRSFTKNTVSACIFFYIALTIL